MKRKSMEGEAVKQVRVRPGMTVGELVRQLEASGAFNGGSLAKACGITEEMFSDEKSTTFLGLDGAMVPAGAGRPMARAAPTVYARNAASATAQLSA